MQPIQSPSKNLQTFLSATTRATAAESFANLDDLSASDQAIIDTTAEWTDRTAVINLLFFANLITESNRASSIQKGLNQTEDAYIKLAAIVGLQSLRSGSLQPKDKAALKALLITEIQRATPTLAERASISIQKLLTADDTAVLIDLINHSNAVLQHNALVGLVEAAGVKPAHQFGTAPLTVSTAENNLPAISLYQKHRFNIIGQWQTQGEIKLVSLLRDTTPQ